MYGRNYSSYPEILLDSFSRINKNYSQRSQRSFPKALMTTYINLFGIPDISFQLRAKYFFNILESIPKFSPKRVLDAGSGIGFYTFLLAKKYPKSEITAVDTDNKKLQFCRNYAKQHNLSNVNFKYGDISQELKTKTKYDLIVNIDVLEHIQNYKQVLKNLFQLLNINGILYLHTPQINQTRVFRKHFSSWQHDDHAREGFDPKELRKEFIKTGFKKVSYWHGVGKWGSLSWELHHLALSKSLLLGSGLYPFIYPLSLLDNYKTNHKGLTGIYLAQR